MFREATPACAGLIVASYINKGQLVSQAKVRKLVQCKEWVILMSVVLIQPTPINWDGYFIFVCCHRARDVRCGACGPQLLKQVRVRGCGSIPMAFSQVTRSVQSMHRGHKT